MSHFENIHTMIRSFFSGRQNITALLLLTGLAIFTLPAQADDILFPGISGGDTVHYGIRDAIFTALERNPTVSIQRIAPDIAKASAWEERSAFEPNLSLSATQTKSKGQRFLGTKPDPVDLRQDRNAYSVGVTELLPTGTSITGSATMSGTTSNLYTDQASGVLSLTINQSLLQGFGFGPNLASLRKANLDVDISQAEMKGVAEDMAASVEKAYWDLYLASQEIIIQEKSLSLAERLLEESQERVNVGKLADLDLAAVRAEAANRRETLIDARGSYEQARLNFLYLLNPSEKTASWSSVPMLNDTPFMPSDSLDSVESHEQVGLKYRSDLIQARFSLKKGEIDIVQTRNGLLPKLDLFVTLGRNTYAKSIKDVTPDINSPFKDTSAGLTFSMPVSQGQARAQHLSAKRSRDQMELAVKNMERTVRRDVRSAYIEVLRTRQQINATKVTRELQEQKADAELEKFRVGKSTNYLVLQAQRDFISSQRDEVRSMVSYLNSLTNLYLMEGSLLERRGIGNTGTK